MTYWKTSRRRIDLTRPAVMGILNVTPDSFSDGGELASVDAVLRRAEKMIAEGAAILDVGGESTRPGSQRVAEADEIARVVPAISAIAERFDVPVSIDTSKSAVARAAIDAGAEIVNDISGLRFDPHIANVAADANAGLVIMHSRGDFETMHSQPPAEDIFADVVSAFQNAVGTAMNAGVDRGSIVFDIGIGFGKTLEQNLALTSRLSTVIARFPDLPMMYASSRKSFIGKLLGGVSPSERLFGSVATAAIAVYNGAKIVRTHDVAATLQAITIAAACRENN